MTNQKRNTLTRRAVLKGSFIAGGLSLVGFRDLRLPFFSGRPQANNFQGGQSLGLVEFAGEAPIPLDTAMGAGLDGRLYTELSQIDPMNPTISNDKFYVRTRASKFLKDGEPGRMEVTGLVKQPTKISVAEVKKVSIPSRRTTFAGMLRQCSRCSLRNAQRGRLVRCPAVRHPRFHTRSTCLQSYFDLRLRSLSGYFLHFRAGRQLDLPYRRTQVLQSFFRDHDEWLAFAQRPWRPSSPRCSGLVWMHLHQMGRSDPIIGLGRPYDFSDA